MTLKIIQEFCYTFKCTIGNIQVQVFMCPSTLIVPISYCSYTFFKMINKFTF